MGQKRLRWGGFLGLIQVSCKMSDATHTDVTDSKQTASLAGRNPEKTPCNSNANFPVLPCNGSSFVNRAWEVLAIYRFLQKHEGASHAVLVIVAAHFCAAFPWDLKLFPHPLFSVSLSGCLLPWQPFFLLFSGIKRHQKLSSLPKTTVTRMNTPAGLVMNGNDSASIADTQRGVALIRSRLPHRPLMAASPTSPAGCDVPPETCPLGDRGALSLKTEQVNMDKTSPPHTDAWALLLPHPSLLLGQHNFALPVCLPVSLLFTDLNHPA